MLFVHYSTENWKDEAIKMIKLTKSKVILTGRMHLNEGGFTSHKCSSVHKKHLLEQPVILANKIITICTLALM